MMESNKFSGCTVNLHPCRCFEKLTEEETKFLEENSVIVNYKKGEVICKQGGFASHVLYMQNGLAKVYLEKGLNSLVLKVIPTGNLLGLSSVSEENNTFQYSAMAYLDSEVKQIEINAFKKLLKKNTAFANGVIDILIANSIQINGRFFCLTHKQSYGRMADILLCLAERIFKVNEFEMNLSRKDLAELSGLSTETVVRMLKKFKDDNLIYIDGKDFRIIDFEKLKRISETG